MAYSSRFVGLSLFLVFAVQKASTFNCGWPGKPVGGSLISSSLPMPVPDKGNAFSRYVPPSRVLSYDYQFVEGQVVAYQCRTERQDILKGNYFNRTCQADGRWSGTRPWCDINVAFGKTVSYASIESTMSDTLMTDGLINSEDPVNTAECPPLGKIGPYLSVELGENFPVRIVGILGKGGEGMNNLVNKKVTLGTSVDCPQTMGNASAFGYQCNRQMSQVSTSNAQGSTIRFEHGSSFIVDVCEVIVYANPTVSDCGEPEIPAFGEVTITTSSSYQEARYNCRSGYELQGKDVRTCYGRDWEGEQPICVETFVSSTTEINRNSTDPYPGGSTPPGSGGLDPFQIVLIVVCVALAIGLIVALIVLLKYGRLSCCGTHNSSFSKKVPNKKPSPDQRDYQKVTTVNTSAAPPSTAANKSTEEANKRAAALAAAEQERRAEEEAFSTRLAYQNERPPPQQQQQRQQQSSMPQPKTITYVELTHEPTKRVPDSPAGYSLPDSPSQPVPHSPVYAKVNMRNSKTTADDKGKSSSSDEATATPPMRKSYIPSIYLKESPEVQMKQQALNDQLKQAVRISRNTDF